MVEHLDLSQPVPMDALHLPDLLNAQVIKLATFSSTTVELIGRRCATAPNRLLPLNHSLCHRHRHANGSSFQLFV